MLNDTRTVQTVVRNDSFAGRLIEGYLDVAAEANRPRPGMHIDLQASGRYIRGAGTDGNVQVLGTDNQLGGTIDDYYGTSDTYPTTPHFRSWIPRKGDELGLRMSVGPGATIAAGSYLKKGADGLFVAAVVGETHTRKDTFVVTEAVTNSGAAAAEFLVPARLL